MQNWKYIPHQNMSLTLAADARLCHTDYVNDHIWQLRFGASDTPIISLETTYGLRTRLCRIFPRFFIDEHILDNPLDFYHPIEIDRYYPNYVKISFKLVSYINVKLEYWVPSSHSIAGRAVINNNSDKEWNVTVEWDELLLPTNDGFRMTASEINMTTVLVGKTSNLSPIFFLVGGTTTGKSPYPSLSHTMKIPAKTAKEARWVQASLDEINQSFSLARETCTRDWDAEVGKILRLNLKSIEIITGNKDWDNAFLLSRNKSWQLFQHPIKNDTNPSFVLTRSPDHGFSLSGDGLDYNHLWNGLSISDAYYLKNFILPDSPMIYRYLLQNHLATQDLAGEIDWKPGLGGQFSHIIATPMLANMALVLYDIDNDKEFLKAIFPKLLAFYQSWYSSFHDRDGDRIPEWDQIIQSGDDDHPLFTKTIPDSHGTDISSLESPDLISYLFRECTSILKIAEIIEYSEDLSQLQIDKLSLCNMIEQTWSDIDICYHRRDRDTHTITPLVVLGNFCGVGMMKIDKEFSVPIRPVLHLISNSDTTKTCQFFIHGIGISGVHRIENIAASDMQWLHGHGYSTSNYCYSMIEKIDIIGIRPDDTLEVTTFNYHALDLSLLLPLWAGISPVERAEELINHTIFDKDKFLGPNGLRFCSSGDKTEEEVEEIENMHFPLVSLVLDGIIQYQERKKAVDVFQRLMVPVIQSLQQTMSFHTSYNSKTRNPCGVRDVLSSLLPIGLFLNLLGVRIYNPNKVEVDGYNYFPWPVTLKYQGLTIIKHEKKSLIIFPDGENVHIYNDKKQIVQHETTISSDTSGTSMMK